MKIINYLLNYIDQTNLLCKTKFNCCLKSVFSFFNLMFSLKSNRLSWPFITKGESIFCSKKTKELPFSPLGLKNFAIDSLIICLAGDFLLGLNCRLKPSGPAISLDTSYENFSFGAYCDPQAVSIESSSSSGFGDRPYGLSKVFSSSGLAWKCLEFYELQSTIDAQISSDFWISLSEGLTLLSKVLILSW